VGLVRHLRAVAVGVVLGHGYDLHVAEDVRVHVGRVDVEVGDRVGPHDLLPIELHQLTQRRLRLQRLGRRCQDVDTGGLLAATARQFPPVAERAAVNVCTSLTHSTIPRLRPTRHLFPYLRHRYLLSLLRMVL